MSSSEKMSNPVNDVSKPEGARGSGERISCECQARVLRLISGGIGLMNHSEFQQTVLKWWGAVMPELANSCAPCPCDALRLELAEALEALEDLWAETPDYRSTVKAYGTARAMVAKHRNASVQSRESPPSDSHDSDAKGDPKPDAVDLHASAKNKEVTL